SNHRSADIEPPYAGWKDFKPVSRWRQQFAFDPRTFDPSTFDVEDQGRGIDCLWRIEVRMQGHDVFVLDLRCLGHCVLRCFSEVSVLRFLGNREPTFSFRQEGLKASNCQEFAL